MSAYVAWLRQELTARNSAYAASQRLPHVFSYGEMPVVVYEPFAEGFRHGNFLDATYSAILSQPEWSRRLGKVHSQAARSLPRNERRWKELDSCMSSDALLTSRRDNAQHILTQPFTTDKEPSDVRKHAKAHRFG